MSDYNELVSKLNKEYKDEIDKKISVMLDIQSFADKLPLFKERILNNKLREGSGVNLGNQYKHIPLAWGIWRIRFDNSNKPTNYDSFLEETYLLKIYINTFTLYGSHEKHGLFDQELLDMCFYTDYSNSTFYVEDKLIERFLDKLNEWYIEAKKKQDKLDKDIELKDLEKRLEDLKQGGNV